MKILVMGYGNECREDDRLGHDLAPVLTEWLTGEGHDAELWLGQQLLPELAFNMGEVDVALFVDASVTPYEDGYQIEEVQPSRELDGLNIHSMGAPWLMSLMGDLKLTPPRTYLLSVNGYSFNFSENLTEECRRNVEKAAEAFKAWWKENFEG